MTKAPRSAALDGLRGIAALSVLAFHVWLYRVDRPHSAGDRNLIDRVLFEANAGLILFFVLSGFLLYRGYARAALVSAEPPRLAGYVRRRAARIVPAYYVCVVGCIALYLTFGPTRILPPAHEWPAFFVFGQNYSLDTLMQINPVFWTLTVEVAFYVALPFLALVGLRLGPRRTGAHAAFLLALVGATLAWKWLERSGDWGEIPGKVLPAYLGHFALGMLAALWLAHRAREGRAEWSARATAVMAATGLAIVIAQGYWHETAPPGDAARSLLGTLTCAAGFALIVAAVAAGRGGVVRSLRSRPMARLGEISYGVYLWHLPLILVLAEADLLPGSLAPRMAAVLAATLLLAWASWELVERPALRWAERADTDATSRAPSRDGRADPAPAGALVSS